MIIVLEHWCVIIELEHRSVNCTGALVCLLYWSTVVFIVLERCCVYCTGARTGVLILMECW